MNKILSIASITFKEAVRQKVLYIFLFFTAIIIGMTNMLSFFQVGVQVSVVKDIAITFILLFGWFIAIFLGINQLPKEVEKKTIYTTISKPVHRFQFILGKYFGAVFTVFVALLPMAIETLIIVAIYDKGISFGVLRAIFFVFFEVGVIISFVILLSTFAPTSINIAASILIVVLGHIKVQYFGYYIQKQTSVIIKAIMKVVYYLVPNLESFNFREALVHDVSVPPIYYLEVLGYGILYVAFALLLTILIFRRKEL
jgi:ABC-type transport system involved in multi-copper enzyme maturation permease subunit